MSIDNRTVLRYHFTLSGAKRYSDKFVGGVRILKFMDNTWKQLF